MAELADAPDLGSGVFDVQVQVLLSAVKNPRWSGVFLFAFFQENSGVFPIFSGKQGLFFLV